MKRRHIELRHIVDVDGQLIGVDAAVVTIADLLTRADRGGDRSIFVVRDGMRTPVAKRQSIVLSEDEVLFLETMHAAPMRISRPRPLRIAA